MTSDEAVGSHESRALEAGAEALYPGLFSFSDVRYSIEFDNPVGYRQTHQWEAVREMAAIHDAMVPHVRKMIAEEILARTDAFIVPSGVRYDDFRLGHADARKRAAKIATGE